MAVDRREEERRAPTPSVVDVVDGGAEGKLSVLTKSQSQPPATQDRPSRASQRGGEGRGAGAEEASPRGASVPTKEAWPSPPAADAPSAYEGLTEEDEGEGGGGRREGTPRGTGHRDGALPRRGRGDRRGGFRSHCERGHAGRGRRDNGPRCRGRAGRGRDGNGP